MSFPVLFIGGPWDGQWWVLEEKQETYTVPVYTPTAVNPVPLPVALSVKEHVYTLDVVYGDTNDHWVFRHESIKPDELVAYLLQGYRVPNKVALDTP